MPDEIKTILKIGGDATGATQAGDQAAAAVEKVAAAGEAAQRKVSAQISAQNLTGTAMAGTSGSTQEETQALADLADRERDAKDELADLNDEQGKGKLRAEQFEKAIQAVNNPLGFLINAANEGTGALKALFSPQGLAVGGLTAAFSVANSLIQEMNQKLDELASKYQAIKEMQAEERARRGEQAEDTATLLGKGGLTSPEAIMAADQARTQMIQSGGNREAIDRILPLAVNQAGERTMSDDELLKLSALSEFRPDLIPEVKSPGDVERSRELAIAQLSRKSGDVSAYTEVLSGRVKRLDTGRQQFDPSAIAKVLEQQGEVLPSDEKQRDQYLEDIRKVAETGFIKQDLTWSYASDREQFRIRQRRATSGAQAAGLISAEQAERFADRSIWDADVSVYQGESGHKGTLSRAEKERGQVQPMQPQGATPATPPVTTNVTNNHGPVYYGSPGSVFERVTRAQ